MSLAVALQSVLYYVVACSPCRQCAYQRRRKREAAQMTQRQTDAGAPGLYRHPSPFSTNIYWRDELAMGPGPPQKRSGKDTKASSQRRLMTAGPGSSMESSAASQGDVLSVVAANVPADSRDWYIRRHQREDEMLWGRESRSDSSTRRHSIVAGSSVGLTGLPRTGTTSPDLYYVAKNLPAGISHPPIVSAQPTNRSDARWMLQPPPSAKIMNGKVLPNRDRSDSGGSGRRSLGDFGLGRQLSRRLIEQSLELTASASCEGSQKRPREVRFLQDRCPPETLPAHDGQVLIDTTAPATEPGGGMFAGTRRSTTADKENVAPAAVDSGVPPSMQVLQELVPPRTSLDKRARAAETCSTSLPRSILPLRTVPNRSSQPDLSRTLSRSCASSAPRGHLNLDFKFPDPKALRVWDDEHNNNNTTNKNNNSDNDDNDDNDDGADKGNTANTTHGDDTVAETDERERFYDAVSENNSISSTESRRIENMPRARTAKRRSKSSSSSARRRGRPPDWVIGRLVD
ncbi:MAG: hypothetical protein M1815_000480 [Lichina confinis]|nr:MAG: hypothetical protein M1815_000480 [Lichina confinis]